MLSLESLRVFCFLFRSITNNVMTGPLGNSEFCFPRISMFPKTKFHKVSLKQSVFVSVMLTSLFSHFLTLKGHLHQDSLRSFVFVLTLLIVQARDQIG